MLAGFRGQLPPAPLTVARIDAATPRAKPYKLADGGAMFLLVMPDCAKYWRIGYRHGGTRKQLSLGVFPDILIDEARRRRAELRALVADGIDPSAHRKTEREAQLAATTRASVVPRFSLDSEGGLSFHLGSRHLFLTPDETSEQRAILDATRAVTPKATPCP